MKRVVFSNTVAQLVGKAFSTGAVILISLWIARSYGAIGYGEFTKITTYVAIFYLFSDFGLNAIYLQKSSSKNDTDEEWQILFGLRIIGSFILMFLALAILSFLPRDGTQGYNTLVRIGIIVFVPTILFQSWLTTANAYFQKHLLYSRSTIAVGVGSVTTLALLFLSFHVFPAPGGILLAIIVLGIGSSVMGSVALYFMKRFRQPVIPLFTYSGMTALFVATIPFGLTLLFNVVYFRVDSIVLTLTRSTTEVGLYGLAYKVFELSLIIPTFFMNAVYPILLEAKQKNKNMFFRVLKRSSLILLLCAVGMTVSLWLVAPYLTVVKEDFAGSVGALRILSLGLPFFFLSSLSMWVLVTLLKQRMLLGIYGISMIVTILLDSWLIPGYGYTAAAWITVASEGFVLFLSVFFLFRELSGLKNNGAAENSAFS